MNDKLKKAHMAAAFAYAQLSHCNRKKVGCVFAKNDDLLTFGFNGTPPGWENCCEDENGKTLPEVYHAESNAIAKLARGHESGEGASVFLTCEPCIDCAKLLAQIRVKEVFYAEEYVSHNSVTKGMSGIDFLKKGGIPVIHFPVD